jgi:hypothetical protein
LIRPLLGGVRRRTKPRTVDLYEVRAVWTVSFSRHAPRLDLSRFIRSFHAMNPLPLSSVSLEKSPLIAAGQRIYLYSIHS